MTDPIAAPSAAAGQLAAVPAAAVVGGVFGVPMELLAWALFGGLIAIANIERKHTGLLLAFDTAFKLTIAAGVGGALASLGADIATQLVALMSFDKIKMPGSDDVRMVRGMAIFLAAATAIIPEIYRFARERLVKKGQEQ